MEDSDFEQELLRLVDNKEVKKRPVKRYLFHQMMI